MEKKSLINTLKSTKKANVVNTPARNEGGSTRKSNTRRAMTAKKAAVKYARFV